MMVLKHDAQGFLVGDLIDIGVALKTWDTIQKDVQAIRKAVTTAAASMTAGTKGKSGRERTATVVALPAGHRGDNANALTRRTQTPSGNSLHAASAVRQESRAATKAIAVPAGRDGRGRFVAGNTSIGGGLHDRDTSTGDSAIRGFADRVVSAVNGAGAGMEEADPAVKAFNEVAQPMARGYEMVAGRNKEKGQEGWLRRIYSSLTGFSKEETAYSKATNKSLKKLEDKPVSEGGGSGGGGLLGAMSGLLSKIPLVGPMLAGGGGAGMMAGAGKGLMGAGKGMLRRIPLLGALIGGVGAASDIYSSETDDSLTRRQKDEKAGTAVGGFAGSVGGMLAGAKLGAMAGAIGGPIGVAIGGVLGGAVGMFFGDQAGQIIGDTVGGWVSDLREADIPGKIIGAWESTTAAIKSGWDSVTSAAGAAWDSAKKAAGNVVEKAKDVGNRANEAVKTATGIDVKATAVAVKDKAVEAGTKAAEVGGKAVDATVQAAGKAGEAVKQGAVWAGENTTVGKGAVAAYQGIKSAGDWALGQTSKMFESGKGGAATVSSGKGDLGGASYGTYQLSSKMGKVQDFLKTSKYGDQFAGLQPGTPEFNAKWKEVAKADPEFSGAQHDYIKKTNFDPAMKGLDKAGFDTSNMSQAMQDSVWSTSVQFGAGSEKKGSGAIGMFKKAFAGKDYNSMSDEDRIKTLQDYKLANNDKMFASSSENVRAGTAKRASDEKERLLALSGKGSAAPVVAQASQQPAAASGIASPAAPVVASISSPPISVTPAAPTIAEAPQVAVPMASTDTKKAAAVSAPSPDAGQDLKDRRIAHIVTGGLSA